MLLFLICPSLYDLIYKFHYFHIHPQYLVDKHSQPIIDEEIYNCYLTHNSFILNKD